MGHADFELRRIEEMGHTPSEVTVRIRSQLLCDLTSAVTPSLHYPDMLRSEGAGEFLIGQERVVRQRVQEIDKVDLVLA